MKKIISIVTVLAVVLMSASAFAGRSASESYAQQGQQQGQVQGQGQSQQNVLANSGNSAVVFENSFNGSKPIRYLPVASDIQYQGLKPSMFASPRRDNGANFIAAKNLVDLMGAWHTSQIKDSDVDMDDIIIDITKVGTIDSSAVSFETDDTVNFSLQGTDKEKSVTSKPIAIGTIKCDSDDINSVELFMALALKAKELGAHNVILIGEGVQMELESSGWGIGMSYNYAGVNSDAYGSGQVGAGGTGYSTGKAKYHKMPYLMFALKE